MTAFTKARKACFDILKLTDRIPEIDCFSEVRECVWEREREWARERE